MQTLLLLLTRYRIPLFIVFLLLISFSLRVVLLSSLPAGFHFDEATAGYNAYSLLETGSTAKNGPWPLYLDTFGDYRPMGIVYLMIPSIAVFGLTEFAVRLPTAVIGALSPLLLFYLVRMFTKKVPLAALSATFLALSPWHITLSRATSEAVIAVFLAMVIMLTAYQVKEKGSLLWAICLYLIMTLSYISYHPINLFLLFMIPVFLLLYWGVLKKRKTARLLLLGVFTCYLIFPFFTGIIFSNSTERLGQVVSIFGEEERKQLEKQFVEEGNTGSILLARAFHNKVVNAIYPIAERYTVYFTPQYLFFDGGLPKRYQTPGTGLIGLFELIGLAILLISLFSIEKKKAFLFFLIWLMVGPIAAAITSDDHPNLSRAVLMLPAVQVLAAYGVMSLRTVKHRKYVMTAAVVFGMITLWHYAYFFHQYAAHERFYQWLDRSYPAKEAVKKLSMLDRDKKVLVTTNFLGTDVFVLFYEQVDPLTAQRAYAAQGKQLKTLKNYTFVNEPCPLQKYPRGYDYALEHDWCVEPKEFPVDPIIGADGRPAFKIVENKDLSGGAL